MARAPRFLLDVNALVALLDEDHIHHKTVTKWFNSADLQWAICPFTEAGLLRYMTQPTTGQLSVEEATALLARLAQEPGYHYQPITADWQTLCSAFFPRLFGHKQITDAFLLGLAVHEGLVLATFDRAILHLAGEHQRHVFLLPAK